MPFRNLFSFFLSSSTHYEDVHAVSLIHNTIIRSLEPIAGREVIILCIGTDRSTGDSLGPLVGTKLHEKQLSSCTIIGTLHSPIHALNLVHTLEVISQAFHHPFIIAIDASLGKSSEVGNIQVHPFPLRPGSAFQKDLPPVGNIHITGTVNACSSNDYHTLQTTSLYLVNAMAEVIANSLLELSFIEK